MALVGEVIADRYELEELVGSGGMSSVFRARDRLLERNVARVTQTGTVLGTSQYIAPEQASGQPVDAQTDVYSLGAVLYELLTGSVPFDGESFVSVALKHVHEQAPSVLERRPDCPLR